MKYVNNNGESTAPPNGSSTECKQLFAKAQCLVHHTYCATEKKLMLTDIQGTRYNLYDPEIATEDLLDVDANEVYFCCGNLSSVGMEIFSEGTQVPYLLHHDGITLATACLRWLTTISSDTLLCSFL